MSIESTTTFPGVTVTSDARDALADAGLPDDIACALLALADNPGELGAVWESYRAAVEDADAADFAATVAAVTGSACEACSNCSTPAWEAAGCYDADAEFVCAACEPHYTRCEGCEDLYRSRAGMTWVGDYLYCGSCRDDRCSFCDQCGDWFHDDDGHRHDEECGCVAPRPRFRFPANGRGSVGQDERLRVELPAGFIDTEGVDQIVARLWSRLVAQPGPLVRHEDVARTVVALEQKWQTRRGNFTKRLSKALYERHGIKLAPGVLSEIGNLARQHSSDAATWPLEFTRDLNQPPEAFYNDDSCWWGCYRASRCALKSWGGLALRSYAEADDPADCPAGRAWVQPLDPGVRPTHDAAGAHAYLVYNCYGNLEGYAAARLVAYLTSRTYRRIPCSLTGQYVNGNTAYLVADQATCERVDFVDVAYDLHACFDADRLHLEAA